MTKYPNVHNQRRHYLRRRAIGLLGECASYKHANCRVCDCGCHDFSGVLNAASASVPTRKEHIKEYPK